ncbi:MAG: DUF393 domain-containing protein [Gammaproteobacteria bacterium]|nr:DUF393 domain-containing protein [Gammaproteobacteria bacterium]
MNQPEVLLVYDKQCPACDFYCKLARIRESVGQLILVDARDGGPVMDKITAAGLDIDQGMVLIMGDRLYYGADAIHMLSILSSRSGFFNRIAYWMFRSARLSRVLYPVMRSGRNLLLKMLGKSRINNLGVSGNDRF